MAEFWETAFVEKELMWGLGPSASAELTAERFADRGARQILIPGIGYGRNARPFLDRGMSVTGIEISEKAISLARSELGLTLPIHHGSVEQMPFDDRLYDGIFAHGLLYLLDAPARAKLIADCARQLSPGGEMVFSLIARQAPMFTQAKHLGDNWYETPPGVRMLAYDAQSIEREIGPAGQLQVTEISEPGRGGHAALPFLLVVCRKG